MSRFGGRFVPNIEHEVRKQATEPVVKWRQQWVVPTNTSGIGGGGADASAASTSAAVGVKILKWVKVEADLATFPEDQDVQAEDRIQNDAAIVEAPVQSIHNAPAVSTPSGPSLTSAGGGLGTIAPKEPPSVPSSSSVAPVSAIPAHVTQSFSEATSGANTTGDNTPDDSVANTPSASAAEDTVVSDSAAGAASQAISAVASSQGGPFASTGSAGATGANTPQVEPQVDAQLHDLPIASTTDNNTLAVLAGQAEAEQQPATEAIDVMHIASDPAATVPAARTDAEGVPAQADVEMNDS